MSSRRNIISVLIGVLSCLLLLSFQQGASSFASKTASAQQPDHFGPCTTSEEEMVVGTSTVSVFFPADRTCSNTLIAPYPAVFFAHGFTFFGLMEGRLSNSGHGRFLASWGYVAIIPTLPDDLDERANTMEDVIQFIEAQNSDTASSLHGMLDFEQLAMVGYSLGGATALMLAAQDNRVQTVFALDPVYEVNAGGPQPIWDPETDGGSIQLPVGIIGSTANSCNSDGDFAEIYEALGSFHKGSYEFVGANHCTFADPGSQFCNIGCSGSDLTELTELSQTYMRSWLDYYMKLDTEMYSQLYGEQSESDVVAGLTTKAVDTRTKGLTAEGFVGKVELNWLENNHDIISGYQIHRRGVDGVYPDLPLEQLPNQASFSDRLVQSEETYFYQILATDPAGNLFQLSSEAEATALTKPNEPDPDDPDAAVFIWLPLILR